MTIQIDDAGWGDPVGGVIIGIYRVETEEFLAREIEITHFQSPSFSKKTFLARGLEIVLKALQCFSVKKKEPIEICRGVVLDGVRTGLIERGYNVIPTKIEGHLQELVEANFVGALEKLGIPDIPLVSGKERFFRQLEWVQKDLQHRERYAKTGWKNWPTKLRHWKPAWRQQERGPTNPPIIIKLGGSIITDKTKPSTPNHETINLLAQEIASIKSHPIIIVHGGGSFGHFPAEKYQLKSGGRSSKKKLGVTETLAEMTKLSQLILSAFQAAKRPAVLIRSSSVIMSLDGRISHMDLEAFNSFLQQGFIPILSGDVVADTVSGFTIMSGDQITMYLARILNTSQVIFATDVNGIYTDDPKQNPKARQIPLITPSNLEEILKDVAMGTANNAADVTAGMRGKLTEILKGLPKGCEVLICDLRTPGTLARILAGRKVPCTRLRNS